MPGNAVASSSESLSLAEEPLGNGPKAPSFEAEQRYDSVGGGSRASAPGPTSEDPSGSNTPLSGQAYRIYTSEDPQNRFLNERLSESRVLYVRCWQRFH